MQPDFYDNFYTAIAQSVIHSQFCEFSYGIDLCQHGFADKEQLALAVDVARIKPTNSVLDIGCGNGMITEYLFDRTGARFTGVDNSAIAISSAKNRIECKNKKLTFIEGDINDLHLAAASYDVIVSIDTIYFSIDYDQTMSRLKATLKPNGFILLFYSIGPALLGTEEFPRQLLEPENTPLAQAFSRNGFIFNSYELTAQDYELAQKRKRFLTTHKGDFEREGIVYIYDNRLGDSIDIIKYIEEKLHRRYLYVARINGQ